ncbi:hypothetical protein [Pelagicoccus mobilis]|uniref:PBP domain-containing protein n=1 Tax=Pelagicoccus mobilis TaxID=415221 RepID=A0A934VMW8_9BACT|nr:hypothetical protein [Pelagicoccus mobilis]MBK1875617.1 hypothetical protein [Pelagicoccus mobilis]
MTESRYRAPLQTALTIALLLITSVALSADPIVLNPENQTNVDEKYIRSILTGTERFWEDGNEVLIAVLKNDPEAEQALNRYSGMTSSKFKNHWQRIAFSGRGKMPKQFNNLEELIEFVNRNPGAIAIVGEGQKRNGATNSPLTLISTIAHHASGPSDPTPPGH